MQLDFNRSLPVNMGARQIAPVAARQQQETVTVDPEQPEARSAKGFLVPLDERLNAKLAYDRHTRANQGAISQYLLTQHADKREQIQKMVGIDLYA
ncbi:hypothetical protein [Shewanella cyperi]|uniref:Uncharacterized protein n=1 Tax=Shewanella cyperi TaxID=2814292 RepID=A0A974XN84_9GAMM|nr:hypothetical protein [Shewanella cyperi]QSX31525.1 hypothetical protein JYB88_07880 [Shewanella cyperi]QSX42305.1 hypothetical protein JYB84_07885 [Shewanella cyperi]